MKVLIILPLICIASDITTYFTDAFCKLEIVLKHSDCTFCPQRNFSKGIQGISENLEIDQLVFTGNFGLIKLNYDKLIKLPGNKENFIKVLSKSCAPADELFKETLYCLNRASSWYDHYNQLADEIQKGLGRQQRLDLMSLDSLTRRFCATIEQGEWRHLQVVFESIIKINPLAQIELKCDEYNPLEYVMINMSIENRIHSNYYKIFSYLLDQGMVPDDHHQGQSIVDFALYLKLPQIITLLRNKGFYIDHVQQERLDQIISKKVILPSK